VILYESGFIVKGVWFFTGKRVCCSLIPVYFQENIRM
jgi:hypothetical protein